MDSFPDAMIIYDKFHFKMFLNDAVNETRMLEMKNNAFLKGSKYLWLRNPETLSDKKAASLAEQSNTEYNIPIAYVAASLAQAIYPRLFLPVFIGAYWFTNLLGLILMHVGIRGAATEKIPAFNRAGALWWLAISLGYTVVIALLIHWGILRPVEEYLHLAAHP